MKRSNSNKKIILPLVAIAGLASSSLALAGNNSNSGNNTPTPASTPIPVVNPSTNFNSAGIISAIKNVGNQIVAMGEAGATALSDAMFQYDPNLLNFLNANTAATTVAQALSQNAGTATNTYIQNQFQVFPNQLLSTGSGMLNASTIQDALNTQSNLVNSLTLNVPASDTVYSNNPNVIQEQYTNGSSYYIGPPKTNDDSYFNFSTLFAPAAYTSDQQTAVGDYMQYLMKTYNNSANAIDLSTLQSALNAMSYKKQYNTLYNMVSGQSALGSAYQQYQLAMRSNMASQSIALNNLNHMIAERTPSSTPISGISNSQGQAITNPSQLQVEAYQANNRIDSPQWLESLQSQSSTTLQRETVTLLALIAHQNYQAHMDRERIIATLSAMQLQGNAAGQMLLKTKAQAVNSAIANLTNTAGQNEVNSDGSDSNPAYNFNYGGSSDSSGNNSGDSSSSNPSSPGGLLQKDGVKKKPINPADMSKKQLRKEKSKYKSKYKGDIKNAKKHMSKSQLKKAKSEGKSGYKTYKKDNKDKKK